MAWVDKESWEDGIEAIIGTRTVKMSSSITVPIRRGMVVTMTPTGEVGFNGSYFAGISMGDYGLPKPNSDNLMTVLYAGRCAVYNDSNEALLSGYIVKQHATTPGAVQGTDIGERGIGYAQERIEPHSWGIIVIHPMKR